MIECNFFNWNQNWPDGKKSKGGVQNCEKKMLLTHLHDEDQADDDDAHHDRWKLDDVDDPFAGFATDQAE